MITILGSGISGISAGYHFKMKGITSIIFEKDNEWGGLCRNFKIDGYRFDMAIHLSFTKDEYVQSLFANSTEFFRHKPLAYNYYEGHWLKHPAQNNLYCLPTDVKVKVIMDFINNHHSNVNITNYEDWLRCSFGDYFAKNFSMKYTEKYWTVKAADLSTTWINNRIYKPNIEEVLNGAFKSETDNFYYADEMRYPKKNGYKSFLSKMAKECDIRLNNKVKSINHIDKIITFENGTKHPYTQLISSIPLPEYTNLISDMPSNVKEASHRLQYTRVGLVSIGLNKPKKAKYLWFYIYDKNISPARCYSPSLKSEDNVPENASSFQFEIYYHNSFDVSKINASETINTVIKQVIEMGIFIYDDIVVSDFRILDYGNVIYYKGMEEDRRVISEYLSSIDIKLIGRFGQWRYLWSDQSLMTGKEVCDAYDDGKTK